MKKFQKRRFLDFVFEFFYQYFFISYIKIFTPLTLTLSPQAGRGDKAYATSLCKNTRQAYGL